MTDSTELPGPIRDLIDAYCNDTIDDDQLAELEAYLLAHEPARRQFVAYFYLHSEIRDAARLRSRRIARSILDELNAEMDTERDRRTISRITGLLPPGEGRWPYAFWRHWRHWRLAVAAGVCACLVVAGTVVFVWRPWVHQAPMAVRSLPDQPGPSPAARDANPQAHDALAVVLDLDGVRWNTTTATARPTALREGETIPACRLDLQAGRVTLSMLNGVLLTLEGPADLELVSPDRVFCHRGKLRARVPEGGEGFVVASPATAVVDLGTEFGLNVNVENDGKSRVMVFEGEAVAAVFDGAGSPQRTQRVERSKAFELDPRTGHIGATVAGPAGFVAAPRLANPPLTLAADYARTVLKSQPRGYWRFERRDQDTIPNEISSGPPLQVHGPIEIDGATQGNGCALFRTGAPEQFLSTDGLWELARDPGHAIEFWFLSDDIRYASLVGLFPPSELNIPEERTRIVHNVFVELTARNRMHTLYRAASVRFLHRWPIDPRVGNNIVSEAIFTPRRWHHVVAQKNGDRMELYFDGQRDPSMPLIADHETVPCHLVVGRRTIEPSDQSDIRPFVGRIDELAIYEHPLTADEIRRHYSSTLGVLRAERR